MSNEKQTVVVDTYNLSIAQLMETARKEFPDEEEVKVDVDFRLWNDMRMAGSIGLSSFVEREHHCFMPHLRFVQALEDKENGGAIVQIVRVFPAERYVARMGVSVFGEKEVHFNIPWDKTAP